MIRPGNFIQKVFDTESLPRSRWLLVTGIYIAVLTFFSLMPSDPWKPESFWRDFTLNSLHVPGYSVLAFFLFHLLWSGGKRQGIYGRVFILAFSYGVLMEILQGFVPGRGPSLQDLVSNGSGILIMLLLFRRFGKK